MSLKIVVRWWVAVTLVKVASSIRRKAMRFEELGLSRVVTIASEMKSYTPDSAPSPSRSSRTRKMRCSGDPASSSMATTGKATAAPPAAALSSPDPYESGYGRSHAC